MNWQQLRTILWLRWRMSLHQMRRAGIASTVVLVILGVLAVITAAGAFCVGLAGGAMGFARVPDEVVMYAWDAVVVAFIFFWMMGLLIELQRSEVLSLDKLLHLPISLTGTFLINYMGSLVSLTLLVFFPGMLGLAIGMVFGRGAAMLGVFPLLAAFLLMVTALTYQFQGWLAALMVNKRRRGTIIAVVTLVFITFTQMPNLLSVLFARRGGEEQAHAAELRDALARLDAAVVRAELSPDEFLGRQQALQAEYQAKRDELKGRQHTRIARLATSLNMYLPLGWLPYGALGCVRGRILPALFGTLGMGLIAAGSLARTYRTTLRLYTGQFTSRRPRRAAKPAAARKPGSGREFLERRLPGCSEQTAVLALTNFRALTRAPEAKMLLIGPAVMVLVFGSMLVTRRFQPPEWARPFMGMGVLGMMMLSLMQLLGNQFGMDRAGFRVLVLSPCARRHIVLGKNLAIAPLALGLGTTALAMLQVVLPMPLSDFVATLAVMGEIYLLMCMVGNLTSILVPMPMASGSLKPAHPNMIGVLVQLALVFICAPLIYGFALVPLVVESVLRQFGWFAGVPVYLLGSALQLALVALAYRYVVRWQGNLLAMREQHILSVVTTKVE